VSSEQVVFSGNFNRRNRSRFLFEGWISDQKTTAGACRAALTACLLRRFLRLPITSYCCAHFDRGFARKGARSTIRMPNGSRLTLQSIITMKHCYVTYQYANFVVTRLAIRCGPRIRGSNRNGSPRKLGLRRNVPSLVSSRSGHRQGDHEEYLLR
jgi:hypothetical protein